VKSSHYVSRGRGLFPDSFCVEKGLVLASVSFVGKDALADHMCDVREGRYCRRPRCRVHSVRRLVSYRVGPQISNVEGLEYNLCIWHTSLYDILLE